MLKLCRVTKVEVSFLVLVYVFDFDLFEFSAAILEEGLFFDWIIKIADIASASTKICEEWHLLLRP